MVDRAETAPPPNNSGIRTGTGTLWRYLLNTGREPRLILLCGLPGSGGTTLAKHLAREIQFLDEPARDRLERRFSRRAQELPVELHYLSALIDELSRLEARNAAVEQETVRSPARERGVPRGAQRPHVFSWKRA
ncbi:hypothetical protein ACFT4A_27415 [Streptomyces sp. NPDC057099]|uniref:hypothetical protein n=1 Tax=Streptomyces sp. NPDC057099 TaxID=3346019 RepID=UPI0036256D70